MHTYFMTTQGKKNINMTGILLWDYIITAYNQKQMEEVGNNLKSRNWDAGVNNPPNRQLTSLTTLTLDTVNHGVKETNGYSWTKLN